MSQYKKSNILFFVSFLFFLFLFSYLLSWWPYVFAAVGLALALRQSYLGAHHDIFVTAFIFGSLTLFYMSGVNWNILLPILISLCTLYLLIREYFLYPR